MTVTIFTADGAQTPVEGDYAQEVLLMMDLPMKSPWLKIKATHGWHWIDRANIIRVKIFDK
jgi:hypothetical protein